VNSSEQISFLLQVTVFWVVTPYCYIARHQRIGWRCCLHFDSEDRGSKSYPNTIRSVTTQKTTTWIFMKTSNFA